MFLQNFDRYGALVTQQFSAVEDKSSYKRHPSWLPMPTPNYEAARMLEFPRMASGTVHRRTPSLSGGIVTVRSPPIVCPKSPLCAPLLVHW